MDNTTVIRELYAAFARRDAESMLRCYHPDATFSDPVFQGLHYAEIQAMWTMLCTRGKDLQIELVSCEAEDDRGSATWEAKYTFQKTQKFVHNKVHSRFRFQAGLIIEQSDDFDFYRWSRMALGFSGSLLGWTPMVKGAVRREAMRSLKAFGSPPHS